MNLSEQLKTVASLNGHYTRSVLAAKGIGEAALGKSMRVGLLKQLHTGILMTIPTHLRGMKLNEALKDDVGPGQPVAVLDKDDNTLKPRQVVSQNGEDVVVADPEDPEARPEKVRADTIAVSDEIEESDGDPSAKDKFLSWANAEPPRNSAILTDDPSYEATPLGKGTIVDAGGGNYTIGDVTFSADDVKKVFKIMGMPPIVIIGRAGDGGGEFAESITLVGEPEPESEQERAESILPQGYTMRFPFAYEYEEDEDTRKVMSKLKWDGKAWAEVPHQTYESGDEPKYKPAPEFTWGDRKIHKTEKGVEFPRARAQALMAATAFHGAKLGKPKEEPEDKSKFTKLF